MPGSKLRRPLRYTNHELRFHPVDQPELPGWVIRGGERTLRKEGGSATQPMSGEGLIQVLEDLSDREYPSPSPERAEAFVTLDRLAGTWLLGNRFEQTIIWSNQSLSFGSSWSHDHPPEWIPHAIGTLILAIVVVVISLTAKGTMGDGLPESTESC